MENKKLAIKGHLTRDNEVIEILERFGGINHRMLRGDKPSFYYFKDNKNIECSDKLELDKVVFFTLEEFLEKYPFKVGEKVRTIYGTIGNICECRWSIDNCVVYKLNLDEYYYFPSELIPYKEEIKAEDHLEIYTDPAIDNDSKTDITIDGERLIAPNGYTIGNATRNSNKLIVEYIKNKPQYPKTYNECCNVLIINPKSNDAQGYKADDIIHFQELLIARDAYWKIAGEEMGLSEPWKPSANDEGKTHALYYNRYTDSLDKCEGLFESNAILDFPTKEMRDAFLENFKDLIEECKEFL